MPEPRTIGMTPRILAAFLGWGLLPLAAAAGEGTVELVSRRDPATVWSASAGGGDPEEIPAISADGRYVAFVSSAQNLVPGQEDRNSSREDVFLFDRVADTVTLVSRATASATRTGNGGSFSPTLSADGRYVAFESVATDLVAGLSLTAPTRNVFVFDRLTGIVSLVSRAASGPAGADRPCLSSSVSADGRYVTFLSEAGNLVPGMTASEEPQVFLHDRVSRETVLVSRPAAGGQSTALSDHLSLSADGRYLAYRSEAEDLVPGQQSSGWSQVYLYDRTTGTNTLVSHAPGLPARGATGASFSPSLSADGRFVAFGSTSTELVAGANDTNEQSDVFLFDRTTGEVRLISHAAAAPLVTANGWSSTPRFSADGSTVIYGSDATDLVGGQIDGNGDLDLFARDQATGATTLISRAAASPLTAAGISFILPYDLSADGRFVAFASRGTNLIPGQSDINGPNGDDVFLHDRTTGGTVLVSHLPATVVANGSSYSRLPALAADGSALAYWNAGYDLAPFDYENYDFFVYDRVTTANRLASRRDPSLPSLSPRRGAALTSPRSTSADGRFILYSSEATDIVPGQIDGINPDLFLYDRLTRSTSLVTHQAGAPLTAAGGRDGSISADGRFVTFVSDSFNLVPGQVDHFGTADVFLWDRLSGAITMVSHAAGAPTTSGDFSGSGDPRISADGRFVVFTSPASNLVPGQVDEMGDDVFLWDRTTGTSRSVSRQATPSPPGTFGEAKGGVLSADGRYVAFLGRRESLVPGQPASEAWNAFLFDRLTGTTALVSHTASSATAPAWVLDDVPLALSADGRYVAFVSRSPELVAGTPTAFPVDMVFLYDAATGQVRLASHKPGQPASPSGDSTKPALSADGRWLAFTSSGSSLVAGQVDEPSTYDFFLYDRVTDETRLVSHLPGAPTAASGRSSFAPPGPQISDDGRFVAFSSEATDLVAGQVEQPFSFTYDPFLFDRNTDAVELVSRSRFSPLEVGFFHLGGPISLSGDGSTVVFDSDASNLVSGDFNSQRDVFLYRRATAPGRFFTLAPCRINDTRTAGQRPVASGVPEVWPLHATCGIPSTARAVSVNLTVVAPTGAGFLTLLAGDQPLPATSTINFRAGQVRANNAVIPLAGNGGGTLGVFASVGGDGSVHVVLDVNGYFE